MNIIDKLNELAKRVDDCQNFLDLQNKVDDYFNMVRLNVYAKACIDLIFSGRTSSALQPLKEYYYSQDAESGKLNNNLDSETLRLLPRILNINKYRDVVAEDNGIQVSIFSNKPILGFSHLHSELMRNIKSEYGLSDKIAQLVIVEKEDEQRIFVLKTPERAYRFKKNNTKRFRIIQYLFTRNQPQTIANIYNAIQGKMYSSQISSIKKTEQLNNLKREIVKINRQFKKECGFDVDLIIISHTSTNNTYLLNRTGFSVECWK